MRTTNLVLTSEQEKQLVDYIIQRETSLRQDNADRLKADQESWLRYENDAKSREKKGTIFELSNFHAPLVSLAVEFFTARSEDEIASQTPFFHFDAVGPSDRPQAVEYDHYFNWKLDTKGGTSSTLKQAFIPAYVQRAVILKAVHDTDTRRWVDHDRRILFDKTTAAKVEIPNHGVVIEGEDKWDMLPDPLRADAAGQPMNRMHLSADPTLVFDENRHEWRQPEGGILREETLYRGGRSVIVPYNRFLCPMDSPTVDAADITIEDYDKGLEWIEAMWVERPWEKWESAKPTLSQGDATAKTGAESAEAKKENLSFDMVNRRRRIIECWVRRDVLGLGWPQEFVIFIDAETKKAIFYEFQAKVTPDFKRPYTVISVTNSEPGSWCAKKSLAERTVQYQDAYDKQINAHLYRNWQNANPIKCTNPKATEEEEEDLIFDPTKVYHLKPNKSIGDFVQFGTLPNADLQTKDLADLILYLLQLWLSISNLAQGDYSSIPQNNTATGIDATLQESSKLSRRWNRRIIDAFEEHILKLVQITASTFPENAEETYEFSEGKNYFTGKVTAKDIRDVQINVRLVVTPRHSAQQKDAAKQALEVQSAYFEEAIQQPLVAMAKRPLYVQILEAAGFRNTDELLPSPEKLLAQGGPTMPAPAPGEPQQPQEAPPAALA